MNHLDLTAITGCSGLILPGTFIGMINLPIEWKVKAVKNPYYALEFKQDTAKLVLEQGIRFFKHQRARDIDSSLRRWVNVERWNTTKPWRPIWWWQCLIKLERAWIIYLPKEVNRLKMEREILKGSHLLCQGKRIIYAFIREQEKTYPVGVLCKMMKVSRTAYYRWCSNDNSTTPKDCGLERLKDIFVKSRSIYGSRRLAIKLTKAGYPIGRYQVRRLMDKMNLIVHYLWLFGFL